MGARSGDEAPKGRFPYSNLGQKSHRKSRVMNAPREVFCVQARSKVAMHSQRLCERSCDEASTQKTSAHKHQANVGNSYFRFPY